MECARETGRGAASQNCKYYIIKPVLKQDRKYAPFIHTMDSVILKDGIDEVCERVYGEKR